jgi:hypothetical protein
MANTHRAKRVFLLAVLGTSFLPVLGLLLNVQVECGLRKENRILAPLPTFAWSAVRDASYFTHFENYFNDHFGFRDWVILSKHDFDSAVFQRVRPDLVRGKDGYIFYKFIVERYVPELFRNYPREYMVDVFVNLRDELARRGIEMMLVHFPNKELIYHDKLPSYWHVESDPARLPFYQGLAELWRRGVHVLSFTPDFFALKEKEEMFTKAEQNHCSPQAYLHSMRRILLELGAAAHVRVDPPEDFPKVYNTKRLFGPAYRSSHFVNTAYATPTPWNSIENGPPSTGGGGRFFYPNPQGVLPSTTVYTDSFFQTLADQFGPVLLPYFQELTMDYATFNPASITDRTRFVLLVCSYQSIEAHVHYHKKILDQLKAATPRHSPAENAPAK